MYSAPLIHIRTQPGSEPDISTITQNLVQLLPSSSSFEPMLLETAIAPNDSGGETLPTTENESINNRRIMLCTDSTRTRHTLMKCQQVARRTARTFIPVTLTCSTRTVRSGRDSLDTGSETSVDETEIDDENCAVVEGGSTSERALVLDVTSLAPEEVAGKIARWVWWVGEFMSWDDDDDE